MKKVLKITSRSAAQTKKAGRDLARHLVPGDVVTLEGELGAGKTTFAKGVAKGLGVRSEKDISSPTFVLIHEYEGRLPIYHLDWYRLKRVEGADEAMAEECFESNAVTLVEWPERGKAVLPRERIEVRIFHKGADTRRIEISVKSQK